MSAIYDPLGFVSPYILLAKRIFQNETKKGKPWDSDMDESNKLSWQVWWENLPKLEQFKLSRCFIPLDVGSVISAQLHHFADASSVGYGVVTYIRVQGKDGSVYCRLVMAKSRLAPIKTLTIPRLELVAAVLATKMDATLRRELDTQINQSTFWTDSEIVLRYINSHNKTFQTFVANRLSQIQEVSSPDQWRFVNSGQNPADDASRRLNADELLASNRWKYGPSFLGKDQTAWPDQPSFTRDSNDVDLEIKRETRVCIAVESNVAHPLNQMLNHYSSWYRLKKALAWILRLRVILRSRVKGLGWTKGEYLTVNELRTAEEHIVRVVQRQAFAQELKDLDTTKSLRKTSSLVKLEPVKSDKDILCVGGRLSAAFVSPENTHQMIIPKNHRVGDLIITFHHEISGHSGKEFVLAQVRTRFWIVGARRQVARILSDCMSCKKRQKRPDCQRMANLPSDRTTPFRSPFTDVGVDCFGPFTVKRGRAQVKRYGCLFTCLTIRAIHIEKLDSLSTDSFINGLKRFESRRGRPERLRSDNGTNFTSAERELREGIMQWNQAAISEHLRQREIQWIFNPPYASHMGGSWERQIRTVRKILRALVPNNTGLDDEGLSTLFCEVEGIVTNRPITAVSDDPRDAEPLTPNHLLLLRSVPRLPSGMFSLGDRYRKQWRHVQHLPNRFWKRWIQ